MPKQSLASKVESSKPVDRRPGKAAVEDDDDTTGGGGVRSKADAFDSVTTGANVKEGKYEAVLKEMVLQEADEKGQSVRFKCVIASENAFGEELANWFKIFDANEEPMPGIKFLKIALAKLGHQQFSFDDLEAICEELTEEKPGMAIQVKVNDGFTNVYINGLIEDSPAIRALHEAMPDL